MEENLPLCGVMRIISTIQEKRIKQYPLSIKFIVKNIFGEIDEEQIIYADSAWINSKPSFYIEYNKVKQYVMTLNYHFTSIYQIDRELFIKYLEDNDISKTTIETLEMYLYGELSTFTLTEEDEHYYMNRSILLPRIEIANKELNSRKEFVINTLRYSLLDGYEKGLIGADFIYTGDKHHSYLISRSHILRYIEENEWKNNEYIHIGPLFIKPMMRKWFFPLKNERYYSTIELCWPSFQRDIDEMTKKNKRRRL